MAKTPTPAQLAARAKFAAAAKAGKFKRKPAAKRKANPAPMKSGRLTIVKFGEGLEDASAPDAMRDFREYFFVQFKRPEDRTWTTQNIMDNRLDAEKFARAMVRNHPGADVRVVLSHPASYGGAGRSRNPLTRVKVKSPSQRTGAPPSKRLTKRRKATAKAPAGYYANPLSEADAVFVKQARARIRELDAQVLAAIDARNYTTADKLDRERSKLWKAVDVREGRKPRSSNPITPAMPWGVFRDQVQIACFRSEAKAKQYAQAYADTYRMPVGVKRV